MDESSRDNEQKEVPRLVVGSGSLLAADRIKQQIDIADIANDLNLSVLQVKAIESDQGESLPEATYVRGYIRSYAKLLGLDPEVVLDSYLDEDWRQGSNLEDMPKQIESVQSNKSKGFSFKTLGLLSVFGIVAFLYWSGALSNLLGSTPTSSAESSTPIIALATPDVVQSDIVENAGSLNEVVEQESVADINQNIGEQESAPANNTLLFYFDKTSWIDISDGQNKRLAFRTYAEGEELEVTSDIKMNVFIGNAAGVQVEYNGEPFDIEKYSEGVYAKFQVGE